MSKEYGYARISTPKQNIDRQIRNILAAHPQAHMIKEVFTGTKFQGRKELDKLLRTVQPGDTIIFDSVSRMSRNAKEGFLLYQDLFNQGINLVFLKEPHINTDTYKRALQGGIPATGTNVDFILDGVNKYLLALAKEQIRLAFEQAEKEVQDLHQRTAEGIETARLAGKQIGQKPGTRLVTKNSVAAKEIILKHNKSFGGSLNDIETIRQAGITRKNVLQVQERTTVKYCCLNPVHRRNETLFPGQSKKCRPGDTADGFDLYSVIYALSAWLLPHRSPQRYEKNEMPRQLITVVQAFFVIVQF